MRFLGVLAMMLAGLALAGCGGADRGAPDYRYRLTVEVDTPEGLRSGSSVIEVGANVAGSGTVVVNGRVRARARGEAVAVDLPDGKTLFALLRSENEVGWASSIMFLLSPAYQGKDGYERSVYAIRRLKAERELPPFIVVGGGMVRRDGWPMLVTFDDISDPTSVKKVDPRDLAASFGEGVELKRITVQVTEDPVTSGIEERLEWFDRVADEGGGLIPMVRNGRGRWEVAPGYDQALANIGLSGFSTEAYEQ